MVKSVITEISYSKYKTLMKSSAKKIGEALGTEVIIEPTPKNICKKIGINKEAANGLNTIKFLKAVYAKLKEKGYMDELVDEVIKKLTEYGYVNNADYIKSFVASNPNKSKREIERNLLQKGIRKEELTSYYDELDESEDEQEKCDRVAEKYMRNKERSEAIAKKLMSHLLYKGFSFSDAKNSVFKFTSSEVDDYD